MSLIIVITEPKLRGVESDDYFVWTELVISKNADINLGVMKVADGNFTWGQLSRGDAYCYKVQIHFNAWRVVINDPIIFERRVHWKEMMPSGEIRENSADDVGIPVNAGICVITRR